MLFLDDDASEMGEAFHMFGPGDNFVDWNNTGVYQDFACTKGKVHIPEGRDALGTSGNWQIFSITKGVFVATYSKEELGLMVIVRSNSVENVLEDILNNNKNEKKLSTRFHHPNGNIIEYDLDSPKNKRVIRSVNGVNMERDFSQWAFFESANFDQPK